ncbi:NmrA family NAD(P)-binding protein [Streptomyces sp. NPDC004726]
MTILVTGGRGRVGSTLVSLLHRAGFPVRVASAAPEELDLPAGVEAVRCSLADPTAFPAALDAVTSVFLYAEPSHVDDFLTEAEKAGVAHIVLLSSSSVIGPGAADNPVAAPHLAVERALTASPIEASFLRPGDFASNALQWRWALRTSGTVPLPYPGSFTEPIHEMDIAEAAFALLTQDRGRGGAYHLTGPESLSFAEQIAVLEHAVGAPVPYDTVTPEAWKETVTDFLPGGFADTLLNHWASKDGSPTPVTRDVEELTGRPARTFAQWAAENADAFQDAR